MRFEYAPYDGVFYATNLHRDSQTRKLVWEHPAGMETLVVQTPFGRPAMSLLKPNDSGFSALISACNYNEPTVGRYAEIMPGVFARIVPATELGGCPLNSEACTYTVFALQRLGNTYKVFESRTEGMMRAWQNIPIEIDVQVQKVTREQGLFRKQIIDTGFRRMVFSRSVGADYTAGDLYYRVDDTEIPLTKDAIEFAVTHGGIYIKTIKRVEVLSRNSGIRVSARNLGA